MAEAAVAATAVSASVAFRPAVGGTSTIIQYPIRNSSAYQDRTVDFHACAVVSCTGVKVDLFLPLSLGRQTDFASILQISAAL